MTRSTLERHVGNRDVWGASPLRKIGYYQLTSEVFGPQMLLVSHKYKVESSHYWGNLHTPRYRVMGKYTWLFPSWYHACTISAGAIDRNFTSHSMLLCAQPWGNTLKYLKHAQTLSDYLGKLQKISTIFKLLGNAFLVCCLSIFCFPDCDIQNVLAPICTYTTGNGTGVSMTTIETVLDPLLKYGMGTSLTITWQGRLRVTESRMYAGFKYMPGMTAHT